MSLLFNSNLTTFCGEGGFFNRDEILNSTNPDLTPCFEHTVIDLTPCGYLLIFSIPYFLVHRRSDSLHIAPSALFKARMVFTLLLCALSLANLGRGIWEYVHGIELGYVYLISPAVLSIGMAKAAAFLHFDRKKGIRSSSLLTCFWLLYFVFWMFIFKSKVERLIEDKPLDDGELFRCITFFLSYACVLALFIMCFFVDDAPARATRMEDDGHLSPNEKQLREEIMTKLKPCPEPSSSFISRLFFQWFSSMIMTGYRRPLLDSDLWKLNGSEKAGRVSRQFLKNWNAEQAKYKKQEQPKKESRDHYLENSDGQVLIEQPEKKKKEPSLLKPLVKTFGTFFLRSSVLEVMNDLLMFVSPQLLKWIITFTKEKQNPPPVWQGYMWAGLLFVTAIVQSIILQQYFHICFTLGLRLRSAIVASIYRKALVLSNAARKKSTVGEIVNLMSVDAQRFMDLMSYINMIWSGPFQIFLAMYFLWQTMGPSTLAGLGVIILLIPINSCIARKSHKLQIEQMRHKDERIKVMNEILTGIKVLKMYAWELSFRDKVNDIREKELKVLQNAAYLNAIATFTWTCAPFLVSLTTFAVYTLSDPTHVLDAEKAFVSISLFNILQFPLIMLPNVISSLVQANVSLTRLRRFLSNEELDLSNVDRNPGSGPAVSVDNGTFTWDKESEPVLRDINLSVRRGALIAVVGQVGSGKSSLINCLLGDMEKVNGTVNVKGSVAYVAQQAWIQNLTVRENILFGKELDVCKYQETIEVCELTEDFNMLPASDQTEIGERGINLSGGQKQRVSIARAVYQDSDIYLFDDPLSAVDAHVGKNLFENVLGPRGCLSDKTRILVTHGVSFLSQVDSIVVLVNGKISEVGNYDELLEKDGDFAEFLRTYAQTEEDDEKDFYDSVNSPHLNPVFDEESPEPLIGSQDSAADFARRQFHRQQNRKSMSEQAVHTTKVMKKSDSNIVCKLLNVKETENKLMTIETAETGNIKPWVIVSYLRSIGFISCFIITTAYLLTNASSVFSSIWLADWTADPINHDGAQNSTTFRLTIYGVFGISKTVFVLICAYAVAFGSIMASRHIHKRMLSNIMKAPMSFFDTTPIGRIVNRFSKDIYLIDEVIPRSLKGVLRTLFMTMSTFLVIIYSTPIFGVVVLPILLLYWFLQRFYVRTSRQLKRLESISRSPIYSHFSETLSGASTIRAYGLQRSFIKQNEGKVDTNQMAYYPNIVSNRWLALRLEVVGNLIVLFAAVFAVVERDSIQSGIVGLSISYAMQITSILNWMVRTASEVETNIVAVERVEEYANVEQEAPLEVDRCRPGEGWPEFGSIRFHKYSTRYREELDLVVRDINVDIKGGEKVGIVGRTGAGKSSLTLALFRIIESAEGMITIDGRDIGKMGLHSLRSKLSIIPQDPVLFCGTLRMNLDPFNTYSDQELWNALEHSHLISFVSSLGKKLEHEISEGGENLSVGQRQLVCLARALLRKSQILVLDEATAAVDLETDDLIQATIRTQFTNSTTFTIAHRLNTVMDSTRVLVLDAGKVAEYDTPANLLQNKGIFYSMAKDAGLTS